MSRLISRFELRADQKEEGKLPPERGGPAAGEGGDGKTEQAKVYLDVLVKMIPAEVVTLYSFVIRLVPLIAQKSGEAGTITGTVTTGWNMLQVIIAWSLFGTGVVLTPIALSIEQGEAPTPKWKVAVIIRLVLATLAFPLWAYATSGEYLPGLTYNNALSLILVAVYAVVAGIIGRMVAPKTAV